MGAEVRKVASSHAVMVSHSKGEADLITAARRRSGGLDEVHSRFCLTG
jgi:hypothetical protein